MKRKTRFEKATEARFRKNGGKRNETRGIEEKEMRKDLRKQVKIDFVNI